MHNYIIVNGELYHYGVKGMKWGVRKERYRKSYDSDIVLKRGGTVQNISGGKPRDLDKSDVVYGAHTKKDRLRYKGMYAEQLKNWDGVKKVYKNDFVVTKDIRIPSQKKAVELFVEAFQSNPKAMARSIAKAQADMSFWHGFMGVNVESKYTRKFSKAGKDWLETKGYKLFNESLVNTRYAGARNTYFETLKKHGYDAILDINDINNGYKTEQPVIIFNPSQRLKNVNPVEITQAEIDRALKDYEAT